MAGISQVWLTEDELEELEDAFATLDADGFKVSQGLRDKVRTALEPVACKV